MCVCVCVCVCVCETCLPAFQGGCISKLEQFLADHLLLMGAVGIGVACLQVSWSEDSGGGGIWSPEPLSHWLRSQLLALCPPLPSLPSPLPSLPSAAKVTLFPQKT